MRAMLGQAAALLLLILIAAAFPFAVIIDTARTVKRAERREGKPCIR